MKPSTLQFLTGLGIAGKAIRDMFNEQVGELKKAADPTLKEFEAKFAELAASARENGLEIFCDMLAKGDEDEAIRFVMSVDGELREPLMRGLRKRFINDAKISRATYLSAVLGEPLVAEDYESALRTALRKGDLDFAKDMAKRVSRSLTKVELAPLREFYVMNGQKEFAETTSLMMNEPLTESESAIMEAAKALPTPPLRAPRYE
jgi:hypothetical protein